MVARDQSTNLCTPFSIGVAGSKSTSPVITVISARLSGTLRVWTELRFLSAFRLRRALRILMKREGMKSWSARHERVHSLRRRSLAGYGASCIGFDSLGAVHRKNKPVESGWHSDRVDNWVGLLPILAKIELRIGYCRLRS